MDGDDGDDRDARRRRRRRVTAAVRGSEARWGGGNESTPTDPARPRATTVYGARTNRRRRRGRRTRPVAPPARRTTGGRRRSRPPHGPPVTAPPVRAPHDYRCCYYYYTPPAHSKWRVCLIRFFSAPVTWTIVARHRASPESLCRFLYIINVLHGHYARWMGVYDVTNIILQYKIAAGCCLFGSFSIPRHRIAHCSRIRPQCVEIPFGPIPLDVCLNLFFLDTNARGRESFDNCYTRSLCE